MVEDERTISRATSTHKDPRLYKIRRHVRRYWWAYAILAIVVALAIALPVMFVVYRNTAQAQIYAAIIAATDQRILDPTPLGFTLNQTSVLLTSSSYQPWLYPWSGSFYLPNSTVSFLTVTIPGATAYNGSTFRIQQPVQIDSTPEFISSSMLIFSSKNFTLDLRGTGDLKLDAWPRIGVDYDKSINFLGMPFTIPLGAQQG